MRIFNKKYFLTLILFPFLLFIDNLYSQSNRDIIKKIELDFEIVKKGEFTFKKIKRPKIGLTLSGGGLRGFADIGVLEVFEEESIPIDYISGTSIGAVIGGLYAIGYSPKALRKFVKDTDWGSIFFDEPLRSAQFISQKDEQNKHIFLLRFDGIKPYIPKAMSQGQRILNELNSLILPASFNPTSSFDQFKIPINIVATNMRTGKVKVFKSGNLAQSILGSLSLPLLFSPVKIDGEYFWDGGLVNNIPTDVAKEMGSDIIIAVNTTAALRSLDKMEYPWEITDQVTTIMQAKTNAELLSIADVVITPDIRESNAYDTESVDNFIEKGRKAAIKMLPKIKSLIKSKKEQYLDNDEKYNISQINIIGNEYFSDSDIINLISSKPETDIYESKIKNDLEKIFESGFYENVFALIKIKNGLNILEINVKENARIDKIEINGNTLIPNEEILEIITDRSDKIYNSLQFQDAISQINSKYDDEGYSLAHIKNFHIDIKTNTLILNIDEGKISEIRTIGNYITKDYVIRREFPLKSGDIFEISKAQTGFDNLYGTGLFQRVIPNVIYENEKIVLILTVEEHIPDIMKIGTRYDNDKETKVYLELVNENFAGTGTKSKVHAEIGQRIQNLFYSFRADRILNSYLSFEGNLHFRSDINFLSDQNNNFISTGDVKDTRLGGTFKLGSQIGRQWNFEVSLNIEDVKTEAFPFETLSLQENSYFINNVNERLDLRTIRVETSIDTRDKYPFTNKGNFHQIYYETAGSIFGSKLSYVKFYSFLSFANTFNNRHTIIPKFVFGSADATLPYSQRFRWGGLDSFIGKRFNSLHGRQIVAGNLEYRYKLPLQNFFNTYLSFRYDFANLSDNSDDFSADGFIFGSGLKFSIDLPLGPLEVGYGSRTGENEKLYFSIGHKF